MKSPVKGFTLIELLVVIAIIGMLSAIVLASLSTARTRGSDAAAKGDIVSVRDQAQIFWSNNNGSYSNLCIDPNIQSILQNGVTAGHYVSQSCNNNSSAWAVQVLLKSGATNYWCVDSTQVAKSESTALPGGTFACP
jgi:prepilin-type N-terminal cleavage/methylation domain-containing protein